MSEPAPPPPSTASDPLGKAATIARYALRHPDRLPAMAQKAWFNLRGRLRPKADPKTLYRTGVVDAEEWMREQDPALLAEAEQAVEQAHARADVALAGRPRLGGPAHLALLHFLTRWTTPEVVIETGVAAGHSTWVLLRALEMNGSGRLYSSDLPYFRVEDSDEHVGAMVEEAQRARWTLSTDGDATSIPRFLEAAPAVDLFHYDSDKSYWGRKRTTELVWPHLAPGAHLVMDDIHEDAYFHDFTTEHGLEPTLMRAGYKLVGLVRKPG